MSNTIKNHFNLEGFQIEKKMLANSDNDITEFNTWKAAKYAEVNNEITHSLIDEVKLLRKEIEELKSTLTNT